MPVFEQLRLSLIREEPGDILKEIGHTEEFRSRSEFISAAFAEERLFLHKGSRVRFSPIEVPEGYAAGFFTREHPVSLKKSDLSRYEAENFEGLLVICSLDSAQHVWAEKNAKVAASKPLLESYFDYLLRSTDVNDYQALLRYVDSKQEYWNVVREYKQEITQIAFTFIPPNPLDADDEIYELLKEIQREASPDTQTHSYRTKTPGKMNPETPHMEASARIAMKGGGEANVWSGKKLLYSSKSEKARTTKTLMKEEMPEPGSPGIVQRVISRLFGS